MRNCYDCGQNTSCVDTPSHGWLCSSCLFTRVTGGEIHLTDYTDGELVCSNCGDSDAKSGWQCGYCADNHDYCHDDDESWCDNCGDNDYVLCNSCASSEWFLCEESECYEEAVHHYCLNHLPEHGVLFTEAASVDPDGVMTVGDTVVNWS